MCLSHQAAVVAMVVVVVLTLVEFDVEDLGVIDGSAVEKPVKLDLHQVARELLLVALPALVQALVAEISCPGA
jgi:hypothetical protein